MTEHGGNGRDMWKRLKTECDEPPDEQSVAVLKKEITSATILQTVGFKHNSISSFKLHLDSINAKIEPVNARVSEHDLCVAMLVAIGDATLSVQDAPPWDQVRRRAQNARRQSRSSV